MFSVVGPSHLHVVVDVASVLQIGPPFLPSVCSLLVKGILSQCPACALGVFPWFSEKAEANDVSHWSEMLSDFEFVLGQLFVQIKRPQSENRCMHSWLLTFIRTDSCLFKTPNFVASLHYLSDEHFVLISRIRPRIHGFVSLIITGHAASECLKIVVSIAG